MQNEAMEMFKVRNPVPAGYQSMKKLNKMVATVFDLKFLTLSLFYFKSKVWVA